MRWSKCFVCLLISICFMGPLTSSAMITRPDEAGARVGTTLHSSVYAAHSTADTEPTIELSARSMTGQEVQDVAAGTLFIYVGLVTNPLTATEQMTVTDDLPFATTLQSARSDQGTCTAQGQRTTCPLTIGPNQRALLLLTVKASDSATVGSMITNQIAGDGMHGHLVSQTVYVHVSAPAQATNTPMSAAQTPEPSATNNPPTATLPPTATELSSPMPTAAIATATLPSGSNDPLDTFEPNDTYEQAATLALTTTSKLTLPSNDPADFYRITLGPEAAGKPITMTASASYGLLLNLVVYRDTDRVALAQTDPSQAQQVQAIGFTGAAGQYVIQVTPTLTSTRRGVYTLSVMQGPLPFAPQAHVPDARGLDPDADHWENNWSPNTAPRIAPGMDIKANFVCPVTTGCSAGDQDFYSFWAKGGACYRVETDNLGPATDTNIELIGADGVIFAGNDDRAPGELRSLVQLCIPQDGTSMLMVLVGPTTPLPPPLKERTYTLRVSLWVPPIPTATATATPTPTNPPTPSIRPSSPPPPTSQPPVLGTGVAPRGPAGGFTATPRPTPLPVPSATPRPSLVPTLPAPTSRPLIGSATQRVATSMPTSPPSGATVMPTLTATPLPEAHVSGDTPMPTPHALRGVTVEEVMTTRMATPTAIPPVMVRLAVRVSYDRNRNNIGDQDEGIRGLNAALINARTGEVLTSGITDALGTLTLAAILQPKAGLYTLVIPDLNYAKAIDPQQPNLDPIVLPATVAKLPGILP